MAQRVVYGALAIAVLVTLVQLDVAIAHAASRMAGPFGDLLSRGSVLPILVLLVLLRAAVEFNRILSAKGARPHTVFAYVMIALFVGTPWWCAAGWFGSDVADREGLYWLLVCQMTTVIGAGTLAVLRRNPAGTLRDIGATLLLVFYLGGLGSFALQLRCGEDTPDQEGAWLLLIVILVTKASDIGAYFAGTAWGRHKPMPSVSPGKSVEGMVGGFIASAAAATLFASAGVIAVGLRLPEPIVAGIDTATRSFSIQHATDGLSPLLRAAVFGVAMSLVGQFGDFIESCFKRDAQIKDSGSLIPGYGGILDLIDSPVVATPVAWFLLTAVWNVV